MSSPAAAEAARGRDWRTVDAATSEGTRTRRSRRVAAQRRPRVEAEVGVAVEEEVRCGGLVGRCGLNPKAPGARDGACGIMLVRRDGGGAARRARAGARWWG